MRQLRRRAGLAINPNYAVLYGARSTAEIFLGRFEQAKSDAQQAMRLSPRDPRKGLWHSYIGAGGVRPRDISTPRSTNIIRRSTLVISATSRTQGSPPLYVIDGKTEEAKTALAEARRLNPKLTVKSLIEHTPNIPTLFEGLRKAGLPEE